jgi:hypothetical protein
MFVPEPGTTVGTRVFQCRVRLRRSGCYQYYRSLLVVVRVPARNLNFCVSARVPLRTSESFSGTRSSCTTCRVPGTCTMYEQILERERRYGVHL